MRRDDREQARLLSDFWNRSTARLPAAELDAAGARLDPAIRALAERLYHSGTSDLADPAFAEQLHAVVLQAFDRNAPSSLDGRRPRAVAGVRRPERQTLQFPRVARAAETWLRIAAALLIVAVMGAGGYLLWPDDQGPAGRPNQVITSPSPGPVWTHGADTGINIATADGATALNLSPAGARDTDPSWSPDGAQIAFASEGAIWIMARDGTKRRLVADTPKRDLRPRWSPAGDRIAFLDEDGALHLLDVDAGRVRSVDEPVFEVTPTPPRDEEIVEVAGAQEWVPAWSPEGDRVAFLDMQNGISRLLVTDPSGGPATALAHFEGAVAGPVWSPDGERIALTIDLFSPTSELAVVDPASGEIAVIAAGRYTTPPAWSPDGKSLLVIGHDRYPSGALVAADGSSVTPVEVVPSGAESPVWSPDGARLCFLGTAGEAYVVNVDGSGLRRLADRPGNGQPPVWSPDGQWIAFSSQ